MALTESLDKIKDIEARLQARIPTLFPDFEGRIKDELEECLEYVEIIRLRGFEMLQKLREAEAHTEEAARVFPTLKNAVQKTVVYLNMMKKASDAFQTNVQKFRAQMLQANTQLQDSYNHPEMEQLLASVDRTLFNRSLGEASNANQGHEQQLLSPSQTSEDGTCYLGDIYPPYTDDERAAFEKMSQSNSLPNLNPVQATADGYMNQGTAETNNSFQTAPTANHDQRGTEGVGNAMAPELVHSLRHDLNRQFRETLVNPSPDDTPTPSPRVAHGYGIMHRKC